MLNNKIGIIVPTQTFEGEVFDNEKHVKNAMYFLSNMFGGASSFEQVGAWVDDDGKMHEEANTMVYAYASSITDENMAGIINQCKFMCSILKQGAIALEVNNCMMFIDSSTEKSDLLTDFRKAI